MRRIIIILITYITTKYLRDFKTQGQLSKYHTKRLKQLVKFLNKSSPFYKQFKSFDNYPVMNKALMMDNFNDINTRGIDKDKAMQIALNSESTRDFKSSIDDVVIGLSSGTSGNRGMFLASDDEKTRWTGIILAKMLPESILKKQRIALFLRANSGLYESLNSKKIKFEFFDLIKPIDELKLELQLYNPTILVAPPSLLRMLAHKINIGEIKLSPIKIISAAEVLDPIDEEFISKAFNQKVHQIYQCTEGFLGHTCDHGTIHLNEDFLYIEKRFLDDKKLKFFPIITDLERKTQPIIRYELNDILTLKEDACPCGSHNMAIEQIEGREDDIFYFRDDKNLFVPIFPDFIRRRVITSSDCIKEYKVVQESPDKLTAFIDSDEDITGLIHDSFVEFCESKGFKVPEIYFETYEFTQSLNKMKRIESLYNHEA